MSFNFKNCITQWKNQISKDDALTGGPYIRTCPGRGRSCELNHAPEAGVNNTNIPTFENSMY